MARPRGLAGIATAICESIAGLKARFEARFAGDAFVHPLATAPRFIRGPRLMDPGGAVVGFTGAASAGAGHRQHESQATRGFHCVDPRLAPPVWISKSSGESSVK